MYVKAAEYRKHFDVSNNSLRQWADTGRIDSIKTPGGIRLYKLPENKTTQRENIIYARVSSAKQKDDLERQCNYLRLRYPNHRLVTDVGSGINWNRKGFKTILELADEKAIGEVVVASRDRLCRFAFELVEHVLRRKDVRIIVIDNEDTSPEQELSDDLLSIVQIFCCRRNGKRRYEVKAVDTDEENKTEPDDETKTPS